MLDEILVQVEGPTLLRHGICALLSAYRGIVALNADNACGTFIKITARPDVRLLIGIAAVEPITGIACFLVDNAVRPVPVAIVATSEADVVAARAAGAGVLLSTADEPGSLARGLRCAVRGEKYFSPSLAEEFPRSILQCLSVRNANADRGEQLSNRERRVAELAANGLSNDQVAAELHISVATVKAHLTAVYRKLGLQRRSQIGQRLTMLGWRIAGPQ